MIRLYYIGVFILILSCAVESWGDNNKVKLEDVKTLTLYYGRMTTGRRGKPVPQIQCVGGTAGCGAFVPQVVQCYNRGSDGYDIQWECKTDMDNAYRFGRVDVVCEGYDYPEDKYILKGSCGLEYTIDLTKEGIKRNADGSHSYYKDHNSYTKAQPKSQSSGFGDIILIAVVLLIMYALYKTCLDQPQYSRTSQDYDNPDSRFGTGYGNSGAGYGYPGAGMQPPPPGFRSGFTPDAGCGAENMGTGGRRGGGAGNFWTGAFTGGMLGYMFGNRNRGYQSPDYFSSSPRSPTSFSSSSSSSGSTGTRTASGFGGTRRR